MRDKLSALNLAVSAFFRFRLANGNVATTYEGDAIRAIFVAPESGTLGYVDPTDTAGVDVKILVSAVLESQHVYHGNYTRALVHACSDPAQSGVVVKGNNTTARVQRQTFMGDQLDFYTLTLP